MNLHTMSMSIGDEDRKRKTSPTKKVTLFISNMLYEEIQNFIAERSEFSNLSELIVAAIRYVVDREYVETAELLKKMQNDPEDDDSEYSNTIMFELEEYVRWYEYPDSSRDVSLQATVSTGLLSSLHRAFNIDGMVSMSSIIRFSLRAFIRYTSDRYDYYRKVDNVSGHIR